MAGLQEAAQRLLKNSKPLGGGLGLLLGGAAVIYGIKVPFVNLFLHYTFNPKLFVSWFHLTLHWDYRFLYQLNRSIYSFS